MNYRKNLNQFMNNGLQGHLVRILLLLCLVLLKFHVAEAQKIVHENPPILNEGGSIYADIDTTNQRLFLVLKRGVWQYDLKREAWKFIDSLGTISDSIDEYEFGYNPQKKKLQLWSRGVGKVYESGVDTIDFKRVDNSHDHKNQFGHFPFFRDGRLYTFGGYGYWEWHNILTFYNDDTREWSIQNINSRTPQKRVPYSGIYIAKKDEVFIFGGDATEYQHPDDDTASRIALNDIWKFSFENLQWQNVLTLDLSGNAFFKPLELAKVGRNNAVTSSFYIPEKSIWFLPVSPNNKADRTCLLKPINLESMVSYPVMQAPIDDSDQIIPTNLLYDPKGESVVIVGIPNLSNTEEYPVKVVKIARDSLMANINYESSFSSIPIYYILFGGASIILIIVGYIFIKRRSDTTNKEEQLNTPVSKEKLLHLASLKEDEKKLIEFLLQENKFQEAQALEEYVWGDIESFDYRRRLRNDTIKSVNEKVRKIIATDKKLIIRKKDPNDNRRYLYGINNEFIAV